MKDLMNVGLPKWPQMVVTGKTVTETQAKEIIRRTDRFFSGFSGGNNHKWQERIRKVFGMPDAPMGYDVETYRKQYAWLRDFHERWGYIDTNYVDNSWISCAFIYGAHGWMHPDGKIGFSDNVGKWPSVEEVVDDWKKIAEAFPFLDIGVTLMSEESCIEEGKVPLVSISIKDGNVSLVDPKKENVHFGHPMDSFPNRDLQELSSRFLSNEAECGIHKEWIDDWRAMYENGSK
jgi:hypothetical protein